MPQLRTKLKRSIQLLSLPLHHSPPLCSNSDNAVTLLVLLPNLSPEFPSQLLHVFLSLCSP